LRWRVLRLQRHPPSRTVTREEALEAYATEDEIFQDCGDFVVLAAFTTERRRVITFEDRQLVLVSFTGELFRPDTGVAVTYAGSARIEFTFDPSGEIETITETGLQRYLIDLEGKRIVFDAGSQPSMSAATHQR